MPSQKTKYRSIGELRALDQTRTYSGVVNQVYRTAYEDPPLPKPIFEFSNWSLDAVITAALAKGGFWYVEL